jgi:integrase/recombinase XerD
MGKLKVVPGEVGSGWGKLVADFEAHLMARGLSPRTVDAYADVLPRVLVSFCEREGLEPRALGKRHLEKLTAELLAGGRSKQTVKTYATVINTFLRWLAAEGEITEQVRAPKPQMQRRLLDVLSQEEIQALEDAATTERDKLIVAVLAHTGVRLGELRRLRIQDLVVQGRQRFLRVRGKTGERLVPLRPALYVRLEKFIRRTRPECGTDSIFVTLVHGRRTADYEPISESTVQHLIKFLAGRAGIEKRVYPHLLRHSLATELLRRGMNPIQLKDILGHGSLAMIDQVYSHLAPPDAYTAMLRAFPDDRR